MPRAFGRGLGLALLTLSVGGQGRAAGPEAPAPPVELTAEQDHKRLMTLLGITSLRPGADGRNAQAPNAANYDESKANPFPTLPGPLRLKSGGMVTTAQAWWDKRRPEILEDFDREIYGRVPKDVPKVVWEVKGTTTETTAGVPVVTKQLLGHVDNSSYPPVSVDIQLTLTTPSKATGPVPVMLHFGFNLPPGIARGWGHATLMATSVQADNGAGLTRGIIGLVNKGQPRAIDDWGALRAWAWGASRALDYFETDPAVNARQVGIEGLSRYGKAALVAMAYDPRFAIGFIGSSGAAGAKLHRRNFGELVENVAGAGEYHWVAGNYLKYAGPLRWEDLPVDSHELIALCAPRPVFISAGSPQVEGGWIDQRGMFTAAVAAGPVYRLLGKKDLGTAVFPPLETALVDGELAWRQHAGGHTTGPNWPTFLMFAQRYVQAPPPATSPSTATVAAVRSKVALTFDDLPVHGPAPFGMSRADIARGIIGALRAAGFPLGNHAFSHMDLHTHTVAEFEQDVLANEDTLRGLMAGQDWHWFRFPYLREGETAEKRRAAAAMLRGHHEPYARCVARGDRQAVTLDEEQSDPAYVEPLDVAMASGATLLDQATAARHVTPPSRAEPPVARLAGRCR